MGNQSEPYAALGARIKFLREQWQQSLRDLSATLELDEGFLHAVEDGKALPPVEVLDLLISHFLLTEDQAQDLRELANDQQDMAAGDLIGGIEDMLAKQVVMYLPVDNKVVYTDSMNVTVNDNGVVLHFMQQLPGSAQPTAVSRVGMSHEHAERIIAVLTQTLQQHKISQAQLRDSSEEKN